MELTESIFWKYFKLGYENDGVDYKTTLEMNDKESVSEVAKDLAAFANYGGGYILIGVTSRNGFYELENVSCKLDPAVISDKIKQYFDIIPEFNILYFKYEDSKTLGIMSIKPSSHVIVVKKNLHSRSNVLLLGEGVIYYRSGTRSVPASASEIREILSRINIPAQIPSINTANEVSVYQKYSRPTLFRIHDALGGKVELTAKEIGAKLFIVWNYYSGQSKKEFCEIIGINEATIEEIFKGNELPTLPQLIRVIAIYELPENFFNRAIFYDFENRDVSYPPWENDSLKSVILNLVYPKGNIAYIQNYKKFYSDCLCKTANKMEELNKFVDSLDIKSELRFNVVGRYYKVLEWIERIEDKERQEGISFLNEKILRDWFSRYSVSNPVRAVVEMIKRINMEDPNNIIYEYNFDKDNLEPSQFNKYYSDVSLAIEKR